MRILPQYNRCLRRFHLLDGRIGEAAIDFLISDPILGAKDGASVRDVAQRPDAFIGEAFVVALLFLGAEPDAAQRVAGMVGGNAKMVLGVDGFAVRAAGAGGDPRALRGEASRIETSDQAAGGNNNLDSSIVGVA